MIQDQLFTVVPLIFIVAILYSSVGHGGASGYLAVLSLIDIATAPLVPLILVLNVLVASISFLNFRKPGDFKLSRLLPFILTSIPAAYLGGMWKVTDAVFSLILGLALLAAGLRLIGVQPKSRKERLEGIALWKIALPIGLVLGLVSGMIGIGGGVFLSPILIFLGLTDTRGSAAMSSAFIVLNSLSGLLGHIDHITLSGPVFLSILGAGLAGALIGSNWGAFKLQARKLQYVLAVVLLFASVKLLISSAPLLGK